MSGVLPQFLIWPHGVNMQNYIIARLKFYSNLCDFVSYINKHNITLLISVFISYSLLRNFAAEL